MTRTLTREAESIFSHVKQSLSGAGSRVPMFRLLQYSTELIQNRLVRSRLARILRRFLSVEKVNVFL